jgi:hypothetical protein
MAMNPLRTVAAALLVAFAGAGLAQAPDTAGKGARDGSRPADGAITGGSIVPGETGGLPSTERAKRRCNELNGTLREQCLLQEQGASTGGTRDPDAEVVKPPTSPREAPPPQNPR